MRLADFIRAEMEPILQDWEAFARTILPAMRLDRSGLRDHARDMLLEIADDLDSHQTESEQDAKAKGHAPEGGSESSAEVHGGDRQSTGFSVMETVSEFRALRASVVSLWTRAHPMSSVDQLDDLTRFHEAIDQAVAESLEQYSMVKEMETRLFGAVLLASPDPIYVLDLEGRFIYANRATAEIFALEPEAIIGRTISDLGFPFAGDFQTSLEEVMADQSPFRGRFVHTFASGRGEQFEYMLAPVLDQDGTTEATVCVLRDISEEERAREEVWHAAHHDLLTGLPNRRLFLDRLEQGVKHARRTHRPLFVLFMDLDGFKAVNDSLGHDAGDALLALVAQRLTALVREEDTVARLGGDEFTMILAGARHREDADRVARKIGEALSRPFELSQGPVRLSVSIGISACPEDGDSPAALLDAADHAMYGAKKADSGQR